MVVVFADPNRSKQKKIKKPLIPPKPIHQENQYKKDLHVVVKLIEEALNTYLKPQLPSLVDQADASKPRPIADDMSDDIDRIFDAVTFSVDRRLHPKEMANVNSVRVNAFNAKNFTKQMKHMLGVDVLSNDQMVSDSMKLWSGVNVSLIKSLQNTAIHQVKYQVQQGLLQGLRHEEISKNIQERLGVATSRANLIARDQVSKLNGQLNMVRQRDVGADSYIWETAGDERVRVTHQAHQGKEYKWSDPPADTGHPGNDVNCRCIALPIFKDPSINF